MGSPSIVTTPPGSLILRNRPAVPWQSHFKGKISYRVVLGHMQDKYLNVYKFMSIPNANYDALRR
jgi:hypothetical protein